MAFCLFQAYTRTEKLLSEHLKQLRSVAEELFSKEVLYHDDLVRLVGARPWPEPMDWRAYLPKAAPVPAEGGVIASPAAEAVKA